MKSRKHTARDVRFNAAELAFEREHLKHRANGDERRIPRHAANYTKGLPHCEKTGLLLEVKGADGKPVRDLFEEFVRGIDSGNPRDFRDTPLGPHTVKAGAEPGLEELYKTEDGWTWKSKIAYPPDGSRPGVKVRAWESASAGGTFDLEGPDAQAVTMPPAPVVGSVELTGEMGEIYCQALLRDVPFNVMRCGAPDGNGKKIFETQYQALNGLDWFNKSQSIAGQNAEEARRRRTSLCAQSAFRGIAPGDCVGPYLSQFLLIGNAPLGSCPSSANLDTESSGFIRYGALRVDQRVRSVEVKDFMTTWDEWLDVQNGADLRGKESYSCDAKSAYRFIATPRDLATYVHYDALYEAYLNACLILLGRGVPFDPGIPYQGSDRVDHQQGFAHFGGPHILSLVTEVATRALKAVRYQKFNIHRRLRPEALAARLEKAEVLEKECGMSQFASMRSKLGAIIEDVKKHNSSDMVYTPEKPPKATCLLPMAFPEGSPMHPAYGAGHATVAGACVTILKAFFDHGQELQVGGKSKKAYVANDDGTKLQLVDVYEADGKTPAVLTVEGELNKLAANISIGRDWAGVHYFTDYWESILMGEKIAIGILEEQKLTYNENFSMTVPLFEGGSVRI